MAIIPVSEQSEAVLYQDASAGGDKYRNSGPAVLRALNTSGAPISVTFKGGTPVHDHPDAPLIDRTLQVPAVSEIEFPYATSRWFNDADGYVALTYSTHVGLKVAAVRKDIQW